MTQSHQLHDLLIIGGGINGAGIAADAAGRGLDVVLCEKSDLAAATSSWSTKLVHGGLRYLEHYEFGMVRKSLKEREVLTAAAPHIIRPLAFQIPQLPQSRHPLLIRAGLFLYDHLAARRRFPGSRGVKFSGDGPLLDTIERGFEYWDAQVDDARLVLLNALQAHRHGAEILTRSECIELEAASEGWVLTLRDQDSGRLSTRRCRMLVNASGPWVSALAEKLTGRPAPHAIRLVKGSHIVVPRLYPDPHALLLQHSDSRVIFVIPYLEKYSLIGTTEEEFSGDLDRVQISDMEIDYLIAIVNQYFKNRLRRDDIVHTYAGVRPLIDESEQSATRVSRDYRIELESQPHPLMSIYGGKVTTYRVLAETAVDMAGEFFPRLKPAWTAAATLPGGDFESLQGLEQDALARFPWLHRKLLERYLASYGSQLFELLGDAAAIDDLGECFGADLYRREVDYLCSQEWARSSEDILWRRSKLGYEFDERQVAALTDYLAGIHSDTRSGV